MANKKQELSIDSFDEIVGGANAPQNPNPAKPNNTNNTNSNNIKNSANGSQQIGNQGNNNSINGVYHGGSGISQQNKIENNQGTVNIGSPVDIKDGGKGNVYHL